MARWQDALRRSRSIRFEGDPASERSNVMFVLCSENHAAAALAAACEPALVLQTLGGARDPADESTRATIEYAIVEKGVRHVVVCGHQGCEAAASEGQDSRHAPQAAVVSQCIRLREDPSIGPLLRAHRVALRPLWFDTPDGNIFMCSLEDARVTPMGDNDFAKMLALFAQGTESTRNHDAG